MPLIPGPDPQTIGLRPTPPPFVPREAGPLAELARATAGALGQAATLLQRRKDKREQAEAEVSLLEGTASVENDVREDPDIGLEDRLQAWQELYNERATAVLEGIDNDRIRENISLRSRKDFVLRRANFRKAILMEQEDQLLAGVNQAQELYEIKFANAETDAQMTDALNNIDAGIDSLVEVIGEVDAEARKVKSRENAFVQRTVELLNRDNPNGAEEFLNSIEGQISSTKERSLRTMIESTRAIDTSALIKTFRDRMEFMEVTLRVTGDNQILANELIAAGRTTEAEQLLEAEKHYTVDIPKILDSNPAEATRKVQLMPSQATTPEQARLAMRAQRAMANHIVQLETNFIGHVQNMGWVTPQPALNIGEPGWENVLASYKAIGESFEDRWELPRNTFKILNKPQVDALETTLLNPRISATGRMKIAVELTTGLGKESTDLFLQDLSPTVAVAINQLQSGDQQTAQRMLLGSDFLRSETGAGLELDKAAMRTARADTYGTLGRYSPGQQAAATQAALNYYAWKRSSIAGDLTFDEADYKEALDIAVGGVFTWKEQQFWNPVINYTEDRYREDMNNITLDDLALHGNGVPMEMQIDPRTGERKLLPMTDPTRLSKYDLFDVGGGTFRYGVIVDGLPQPLMNLNGEAFEFQLDEFIDSKPPSRGISAKEARQRKLVPGLTTLQRETGL